MKMERKVRWRWMIERRKAEGNSPLIYKIVKEHYVNSYSS